VLEAVGHWKKNGWFGLIRRQKRGQNFPFEVLSKSLNAWYAGRLMQLACMDKTQRAVQHQEAKGLLMLAINHGIRRINEGDRAAIRTTLDFYLLGLESKLLHDERSMLSKYTYNNLLMTFVALEEWDSALQFLKKHRPELAAAERENVYLYNLSIFHFRRGDYNTTLDLLRNVTFADPMYNLESRKMLLKIYLEQNAIGPLESLLENMLTWLSQHPEIGYHREMYRNLARFTGRLLRIPTHHKEARKRLETKIRETPLVAERGWLLQVVKNR